MSEKQELNWRLQYLCDAEISAAIRYLDPDEIVTSNRDGLSAGFVMCISALVFVLGGVALFWLHYRILGR
jgi:predicted membrane-bound dolichyl-phosphate-mannose-protein mannosyltransferase